ncbi:MAG: M15 family metallopeptidase, partial [bacterium]
AFKAAAVRQGTAIVWGGDWSSLRDGPHFELDRKVFP